MRIAWTLLTRSGRSSWNRLGLTAAAVALGMLMLLIFTAGINALNARSSHSSWRFDIFAAESNQKPVDNIAPLKAKVATDGNLNKWQNETITTVSLRATGNNSPQIPGLPTPKEGEYYIAKGLSDAMRSDPQADIGARFGKKQIGIIPGSLSASPDSLEVIRGMSEQEASGERVTELYQFRESGQTVSAYSGLGYVLFGIGATILLFPIVVFISIATQLGSAQREKRYAALRLIGATRRQVSHIMAVESLSAATVGIVIGSLAYLAILPLMSQYYFDSMRFYASDLAVPITQYVFIIVLTLLFCLIANWWGMRHVHVSPLGVARSGRLSKRPRAWRSLLLLPGILLFVWFSLPSGAEWLQANGSGDNASLVLLLLMAGIMSIMFGLLLAGAWLTTSVSQLLSSRTRSVTTLLAGKRIASQSRRVFRSVSGVVLALFAGSFYLTSVGGLAEYSANAVTNNGYSQLKDNTAIVMSDALPAGFEAQLRQQPYVQSATSIGSLGDKGDLVNCQDVTTYMRHACPTNSGPNDTALINFNAPVTDDIKVIESVPATVSTSYLVKLDSNKHLDQLRSLIASKTGLDTPTYVVSGTYAQIPIINPVITELANLAYAGMGVTLFVAIASLIVSTIGGLLERKRSFATLRLGGMTVAQMKRTIMVESLIPLISVSVVACGLGIWVGMVFISALSDSVKPMITPLYAVIVVGSLILAIVAIWSVVPMIDKITRPEENQTE